MTEYCEVCGEELTAGNRSKSYRHRCKKCVAELTKERRRKSQGKNVRLQGKVNIKIELCGLDRDLIPVKKKIGDACYDLCVPEDFTVEAGRNKIEMGFKIQLPHGYCAHVRPRSGYSITGIELKNSDKRLDADVITGIVDENYRGIVGVILRSRPMFVMDHEGKMSKPIIAKGTRIAQMEIVKVPDTEIEIVDHVDENKERGEQGWGSSNKKNNNLKKSAI